MARRSRNTGGGAPRFFARLTILLLVSVVAHAQRAPYVPANDGVVLQRVPASTDPRVRRFDKLRADLRQHPHDETRAVALAHAYIDYGRSTGDARFLGRALAVIQPWMQQRQTPMPVLLVHATIQQSRHFFKASREELKHILELDRDNAQAWLTLATVAMVQGDVNAANNACVHLGSSGGEFMGTVCAASLRALTGHARQAYALLTLVEDPGPKAPDSIKAWIQGLMAETAVRLGQPDKAEAHYRRALQFTPDDNFLLASYGDFLLDQDRPREVVDLVGKDTQSDTSFLRLVLAETALGSTRASADAAEMEARFKAMDRRGSHVYRREQAVFVLNVQNDPQRALKLAQQNWQVQRAPKDVRIYLESALAAGNPRAASPVLDFIARTGLKGVHIDPLVHKVRQASATASQTASAGSAAGEAR